MTELLITGGIGLVSTIVSGCVSWILARKKYNSEVDHNTIENMDDSLEFYKKLSDDNKVRLDELIERNKQLEVEVQELRKQVAALVDKICLAPNCGDRIRNQFIIKEYNGKDKNRLDETKDSSAR